MRRRRRITGVAAALVLLAFVVVLAVLAGTPRGDLGLAGGWRDAADAALPDGTAGAVSGPLVVVTERGAAHCEEQSAVVLTLAWPPGTVVRAAGGAAAGQSRSYVRDPEGVFRAATEGAFEVVDAAPADSLPTGFHRWGNSLVVDPAGDAYVTRPDGSVERWPRLGPVPGCD